MSSDNNKILSDGDKIISELEADGYDVTRLRLLPDMIKSFHHLCAELEGDGYDVTQLKLYPEIYIDRLKPFLLTPDQRMILGATENYLRLCSAVDWVELNRKEPNPVPSAEDVAQIRHAFASLGAPMPDYVSRMCDRFAPSSVATHTPDYLTPKHKHYAPELAVAVLAWQAVSATYTGDRPKQAIIAWLRKHREEYGLTAGAIERIATVANWNPVGGAPKTPG